jgi:hypothetical protein
MIRAVAEPRSVHLLNMTSGLGLPFPVGILQTWSTFPSLSFHFLYNLKRVNGAVMPLHTVALGAALTPTILHTLINHVGLD